MYFFAIANNNLRIQKRIDNLSVRVIQAYCQSKTRSFDDAKKVLSKQFLRSETSISANCAEAVYAQSKKDFLSIYMMAKKVCLDLFSQVLNTP